MTIKQSAAVMVISDNMMLVSRRSSSSRWPDLIECPGGKLDQDEHPVDAAARELGEETSLVVGPNELTALGAVVLTPKTSAPWICHMYLLQLKTAFTIARLEPQKGGPWVWRKLDELQQMILVEPTSFLLTIVHGLPLYEQYMQNRAILRERGFV